MISATMTNERAAEILLHECSQELANLGYASQTHKPYECDEAHDLGASALRAVPRLEAEVKELVGCIVQQAHADFDRARLEDDYNGDDIGYGVRMQLLDLLLKHGKVRKVGERYEWLT